MLRMNAETRVLDCATPFELERALALLERRSGRRRRAASRTISSKTCTISGRLALQLLDDLHARDEAAASAASRPLISLDLLVELGDLRR